MRLSLKKILLLPWLLDLRAERNEPRARLRELQELIERIRIPPMLITTMPKPGPRRREQDHRGLAAAPGRVGHPLRVTATNA